MIAKANIIKLNYPNFNETIAKGLVLVDFWAEWCEPCKVLDPILVEIGNEFEKELIIAKVNADDNRLLTNKYGVMNIPTMILFKNGDKVHHFIGIQPRESIISVIKKYI